MYFGNLRQLKQVGCTGLRRWIRWRHDWDSQECWWRSLEGSQWQRPYGGLARGQWWRALWRPSGRAAGTTGGFRLGVWQGNRRWSQLDRRQRDTVSQGNWNHWLVSTGLSMENQEEKLAGSPTENREQKLAGLPTENWEQESAGRWAGSLLNPLVRPG